MKPWIVLTGICLILDFVSLATGDISSATLKKLLLWVLSAYFFLVVLSFMNEIEEDARASGDYQGKTNHLMFERRRILAEQRHSVIRGLRE
jgi:hypothetical protein